MPGGRRRSIYPALQQCSSTTPNLARDGLQSPSSLAADNRMPTTSGGLASPNRRTHIRPGTPTTERRNSA
eukprot:10174607-Lingulodinium_polyedra.AAC.1